jgi:hypothetical protein
VVNEQLSTSGGGVVSSRPPLFSNAYALVQSDQAPVQPVYHYTPCQTKETGQNQQRKRRILIPPSPSQTKEPSLVDNKMKKGENIIPGYP